MLRYFCVTVAFIAAPAFAQDGSEVALNRTPANAQRFIAATPPEVFAISSNAFIRDGEVASPDACTTRISGVRAQYENGSWAKAIRNDPDTTALTIRWGEVQKAWSENYDGRFYIHLNTSADVASAKKWLIYSVAETRDRVLAAAQYLRESCDKTKYLGF